MWKILLLLLIAACSKSDPILEGYRTPVFRATGVEASGVFEGELGAPLLPAPCNNIRIDANNQIWRGSTRIFAGIPTDSGIISEKFVACRGSYVYAGLSTGELVKVNYRTRDLAWVADIFMANHPTSNILFVNIIATPVINGEFIFAGGLGNAFCKVRDADGSKVWCVPISVRDIVKSTRNYNVVLADDGTKYVVSRQGKVYLMPEADKRRRWWWPF